MDQTTKQYLSTWVDHLNDYIGDRDKEIDDRRVLRSDAVALRADLEALIAFLEKRDLPEQVYRALNACLSWNPHTKKLNRVRRNAKKAHQQDLACDARRG